MPPQYPSLLPFFSQLLMKVLPWAGSPDGWCTHLSPVAIGPLRAGARLAGSLLHGFAFLVAVICSVSVFILAHHDPPLEPPRTRARALQDTIAHAFVESRNKFAFPAPSQCLAPWECTATSLIQLTGIIKLQYPAIANSSCNDLGAD